jgi:lipase maturation factor 1
MGAMPGLESQHVTPGSDTYILATWLFLRALGVIYLIAFVSLGVQIRGLAGSHGIYPLGADFPAAGKFGRFRAFLRRPTIFLWNTSDRFLRSVCVTGAILSLLLIAGVAPVPVLILLWVLYLSLLHVCGVFLGFQWDILLLETGFLSIFLAPLDLLPQWPPAYSPSPIAHWLAIWLLFRLMFYSGVVKLRSGDPTWRNLTAMAWHYETQPIPNRPAWYMHHAPMRVHKAETALTLAIELVVPLGYFAPPPVNHIAACITLGLMAGITLTGNYCFFNLLTAALCLHLFDDAALQSILAGIVPGRELLSTANSPPRAWEMVTSGVALVLVLLSINTVARLFRREFPWPGWLGRALDRLRPFVLVNSYGLFANMTTRRPEIIVEGSHDGLEWIAYEFRWKPGNLRTPPPQVAPHQPRLDWQMWFAALGHYRANPWFIAFLNRLLEGSPDVLRLLKTNPFADRPPRYVRALLYDYHFTDRQERSKTGHWWRRNYLGLYCPPLTTQLHAFPYYTPPPAADQ